MEWGDDAPHILGEGGGETFGESRAERNQVAGTAKHSRFLVVKFFDSQPTLRREFLDLLVHRDHQIIICPQTDGNMQANGCRSRRCPDRVHRIRLRLGHNNVRHDGCPRGWATKNFDYVVRQRKIFCLPTWKKSYKKGRQNLKKKIKPIFFSHSQLDEPWSALRKHRCTATPSAPTSHFPFVVACSSALRKRLGTATPSVVLPASKESRAARSTALRKRLRTATPSVVLLAPPKSPNPSVACFISPTNDGHRHTNSFLYDRNNE